MVDAKEADEDSDDSDNPFEEKSGAGKNESKSPRKKSQGSPDKLPESPARLPLSATNSFYHNAGNQLLEQSDVVIDMLSDPKRDCDAKSRENIKFMLLMNLLRRIRTLLRATNLHPSKERRFVVIYSEKMHKKVAKLSALEAEPCLATLRIALTKRFLKLFEYLNTYAFVLQELYKLQLAQGGVEYAVRFATKGAKAEMSHQDAESQTLYVQSLVVIDILLEECYMNEAKPESVAPGDYCRVIEVDEKRPKNPLASSSVVRYMLLLRQLVCSRVHNRAADQCH